MRGEWRSSLLILVLTYTDVHQFTHWCTLHFLLRFEKSKISGGGDKTHSSCYNIILINLQTAQSVTIFLCKCEMTAHWPMCKGLGKSFKHKYFILIKFLLFIILLFNQDFKLWLANRNYYKIWPLEEKVCRPLV